jgi:hypothetical protein
LAFDRLVVDLDQRNFGQAETENTTFAAGDYPSEAETSWTAFLRKLARSRCAVPSS